MLINLFLLRHGEPELTKAFLGRTDSPLSAHGFEQMTQAVADLRLDEVVTSPLLRCRTFSEHLGAQRQLPVVVDERWQECDFGEWDGLSVAEVGRLYGDLLGQCCERPATPMPRAERFEDFVTRVDEVFQACLDGCRGAGVDGGEQRSVLVVSHAGVIKTIIAGWLGMPRDDGRYIRELVVDYAGLTHLSLFVDDRAVEWKGCHFVNRV